MNRRHYKNPNWPRKRRHSAKRGSGAARLAVLGIVFGGIVGYQYLHPARDASTPPLAFQTSVYYPNCAAAHAAGVAPIREGQPGYRTELDRDDDGVACEPYFGR